MGHRKVEAISMSVTKAVDVCSAQAGVRIIRETSKGRKTKSKTELERRCGRIRTKEYLSQKVKGENKW